MKLSKNCDNISWRLDRYLSRFMKHLGQLIGEYPAYFIIVPFFLSLFFGTGLQTFHYETDPEYLFYPSNSRALKDKLVIQKLFPVNRSEYDPSDDLNLKYSASVIVTPKEGYRILSSEVWTQIVALDNLLFSKVLTKDPTIRDSFSFNSVCAKKDGYKCLRNDFLSLLNHMEEIESGDWNLTYPKSFHSTTYEEYFLPRFAGGVVASNGTVSKISAVKLFYYCDEKDEYFKRRSTLWLSSFVRSVQSMNSSILNLYTSTTDSLKKEFTMNIDTSIDSLPISLGLVSAFTLWGVLRDERPALSKPYSAVLGIFNIILAIGSGWGLLMYCGLDWISINLASIFILLGVGLDDVFIMLSSWNRTPEELSVPERLALCYEEAAVSITITSITNIASFICGSAFPIFPSVWIFCIYSGIGILFIFIWTLTFFGGVLAISGYLEKYTGNQIPKSNHTGGIMNGIFGRYLPDLLNKVWVKVTVLIIYGFYIGLSIYLVLFLNEGIDRSKLVHKDSYLSDFFRIDNQFFRQTPYRLQVVFPKPLDYSNVTVRSVVNTTLNQIKNNSYLFHHDDLTINWLDVFEKIAADYDNTLTGWNINNNQTTFISKLLELRKHRSLGAKLFKDDIILNKNKSSILASRIFLQTGAINSSNDEKLMLEELRSITDSAPIKVIIYNPFFPFFDQFLQVLPSTIQSVAISSGVVITVTFLLIPNFIFTLWVTLALLSIELGVLGSMVLMNVHLDMISMICLLMCIGFSVDYSAHVSYHFISSPIRDSSINLRSTLSTYGPPIIQSAFSTIMAVVSLFYHPSYIINTFSRLIVLVIILGVIHGIILLPILLSISYCGNVEAQIMISSDDEAMDTNSPTLERIENPDMYKRRTSFQRTSRTRASVVASPPISYDTEQRSITRHSYMSDMFQSCKEESTDEGSCFEDLKSISDKNAEVFI